MSPFVVSIDIEDGVGRSQKRRDSVIACTIVSMRYVGHVCFWNAFSPLRSLTVATLHTAVPWYHSLGGGIAPVSSV